MTRLAFVLLTCFLLTSPIFADHHLEGEADSEAGFVPLFDGESIDGWVQRGGVAEFAVEDGAIVGTAVPNTPNSFLCTPRDYSDFELRLEFMVDERLNSGIMFRAQSKPDYKNGRVHGYQAEIDPSPRSITGGIYDEARRGWLFPKKFNNDAEATEKSQTAFREKCGGSLKKNDWNEYIIRAEGNRIQTWLNGQPGVDLTDDMDASGFIGLQVHNIRKGDSPDPPMIVKWRNIRIKELTK